MTASAAETLGVSQIAQWVGVSQEAVRQKFRDGRLGGERVNGVWRASESAVRHAWPERTKDPHPPPALRVIKGGPQTPAGKKKTRLNATRSGIFARAILLEDGPLKESREEYEAVETAYFEGLCPQNALQALVVEQLAAVAWRRLRLLRAERSTIENAVRLAQRPHMDRAQKVDALGRDLEPLLRGQADAKTIESWRSRAQSVFLELHDSGVLASGESPLASYRGRQFMQLHGLCEQWMRLPPRKDGTDETPPYVVRVVKPGLMAWLEGVKVGEVDCSPGAEVMLCDADRRACLESIERHLDRRHAALMKELHDLRASWSEPT